MQLCNETVSLFNRTTENRAPVWHKTLLEGVSWYSRDVSAVTDDGLKTASQFTVRIPFDTGYVRPREYAGEGWTLQKGDYMVKGDVEEVATGQDIMTITAVTDNRRAPNGKHFKVVGQ